MPLAALIFLFIALPLAELYVILEVVGEAIGPVFTVLLLAVDSVLGAILLRVQGRAVWRQFAATLAEGRMPHHEVVEGVLVIFGGAFLVTPGFITDFAGLLLLLPPTRALARKALMKRLSLRIGTRAAGAYRPAGRGPDVEQPFDVNGTATEYDSSTRRLEP